MKDSFVRYANSFQTVINLSLGRISALLELMDRPQDGQRYIHVAGTNGKGSVCAFLESILMKSGLKVGKYTSPNLIKVNERITVNGVSIADDELDPILEKIGSLCIAVEEKIGERPSQFEVWTAAAFEYFARQRCDYVILEAGMGGEYDATNVIASNSAAVITRVDLDHCAMLGNTVEEIARTKCGIIKPGSPVVTVRQNPSVNAVIEKCAAEKGCPLIETEPFVSTGFEGIRERFLFEGQSILCGLGGPHQLENAAIAAETAKALGIDSRSVAGGIEAARHPARLEMLRDDLIFDGAHNPNGVAALVGALDRYFPDREQTAVFACMRDKYVASSLKMLAEGGREFVFTQVEGNPRSMTPMELEATAAKAGLTGQRTDTLREAVSLASEGGRLAVVCGSLYQYPFALALL